MAVFLEVEEKSMNIENIDKTIDFLKTRRWKSDYYYSTGQCFVAIIGNALHNNRNITMSIGNDLDWLAKELGVSQEKAFGLFIMQNVSSDDVLGRQWDHDRIENLELAEQNAAFIRVLESLKTDNAVIWPFQ